MRKKEPRGYWRTFGVCALTAFLIYLPFLIVDRGFFQYAGDFNSQQIPFYNYMNNFVKNSAGQWSWETDLGGSAINSYSFYLMGSPFFWLSTLFPAAWTPYLMVPLLCLKFGVCGFGAHLYLERYAKKRAFAMIGACLYAFSGFTVYNTFFNHFVDCIALFPFMLWALDAFVLDGRRAIFPLFVAINVLNNYFFFAGQVVFLLLYFFFKVLTGEYKITLPRFWLLAFEAVLGVAMGCLLLWPAVLCLKDNPRTVDLSSGFGFLMYSKVQQYFEIFTSLFLPPDPPYLPNIFTEGVIKWTSMTAYLPVVSCAGVLAYVRARKKSAVTKILWACLFMAMVPVLNSSFYALNSSYYARWYYMPILLMCAATMHALEDAQIDLKGGLRTVGVITLAYLVFAVVPAKKDGAWTLGVTQEPAKFWVTYLTAVLALLLFYAVIKWRRNTPHFARAMLAAILGFSVLYAVIHISLGKFPQWDGDKDYRQECYVAGQSLALPDDSFYRIDAYDCYDNVGLWARKPCIQFFNSTITPAIMDFYPRLDVKRDVSSKPEHDIYALRGLLGVQYLITPLDRQSSFEESYAQYGWGYLHEDGTYAYFYNENCLPMGFAYDMYIPMDQLENVSVRMRSNMLVRAIGLTDLQESKYGWMMRKAADEDQLNLTYESYQADVTRRRAAAVSGFDADGSGFTAAITLEEDNLVFFSVPYDEGFTATVNGNPVAVERVSGGMCAVPCPAGDATIVFTYETPGLALSKTVTFLGVLVWFVYVGVLLYLKKHPRPVRAEKRVATAPVQQLPDSIFALEDGAAQPTCEALENEAEDAAENMPGKALEGVPALETQTPPDAEISPEAKTPPSK